MEASSLPNPQNNLQQAIAALRAAFAFDVTITLRDDALLLSAKNPPPTHIVDAISTNKTVIKTLFRETEDGRSTLEWHKIYQEYVAKGQIEGLSAIEAATNAFNACKREWINLNSIDSKQNQCAQCHGQDNLIGPYLTGLNLHKASYTWLHPNCSEKWHKMREDRAIKELMYMGINKIREEN